MAWAVSIAGRNCNPFFLGSTGPDKTSGERRLKTAHQVEALDDQLGLGRRALLLAFQNRVQIFLEEGIACIQRQQILFALPIFSDPFRPLGQTAKPIGLVSGGEGIELAVNVIAVKNCQGFGRLLSVNGRSFKEQEESEDDEDDEFRFLFI